MPKGKDNLKTLDEQYPALDKENHTVSLAAPENPQPSQEQEDEFYKATGEENSGYTTRHLAKLEDSPDLALQIETETRKRNLLTEYIRHNMVEGTDFYKLSIGGRESKPSLSKSGSEKFLSLFNLTARFRKDDETWEMFGRPAGLICYICELYTKNGVLVGEGRGSRDIAKEKNDANKTIKMASKSAQIDAILRTDALSDYFTLDLEDMPETAPVSVYKAQGSTKAAPKQRSAEEGQKLQIVNQLKTLGVGAVDKAGYETAVIEMTQLDLIPENYQEINSRLAVLIQERKAA